MRRRDLIQSLAGAAMIWPAYVARAQQGSKLPKIGYLSDEGATPHLFHSQNSILKGLRERGYEDGRNIVIEYRYAAGKAEQLASLTSSASRRCYSCRWYACCEGRARGDENDPNHFLSDW
jgi:putative tryptophan/tyrosine transport system substrate-binding protein